MEMFGIGTTELIVIGLLAMIVLGPERLARTAREAGKLVRNIKAYFSTLTDELKTEIDLLDELNEVKRDINRL
jgi:sec-independent protein translocase protein TatB